MSISVIKIGWYSYAFTPDVSAVIIQAAAEGKIREVTTKNINGQERAVLGKPLSLTVDNLEETTENEASVAELKAQIAALEKRLG